MIVMLYCHNNILSQFGVKFKVMSYKLKRQTHFPFSKDKCQYRSYPQCQHEENIDPMINIDGYNNEQHVHSYHQNGSLTRKNKQGSQKVTFLEHDFFQEPKSFSWNFSITDESIDNLNEQFYNFIKQNSHNQPKIMLETQTKQVLNLQVKIQEQQPNYQEILDKCLRKQKIESELKFQKKYKEDKDKTNNLKFISAKIYELVKNGKKVTQKHILDTIWQQFQKKQNIKLNEIEKNKNKGNVNRRISDGLNVLLSSGALSRGKKFIKVNNFLKMQKMKDQTCKLKIKLLQKYSQIQHKKQRLQKLSSRKKCLSDLKARNSTILKPQSFQKIFLPFTAFICQGLQYEEKQLSTQKLRFFLPNATRPYQDVQVLKYIFPSISNQQQ